MHISMHIYVLRPHVTFNQLLILLSVSTSHNNDAITGNEPAKLFKPVRFARYEHTRACDYLPFLLSFRLCLSASVNIE